MSVSFTLQMRERQSNVRIWGGVNKDWRKKSYSRASSKVTHACNPFLIEKQLPHILGQECSTCFAALITACPNWENPKPSKDHNSHTQNKSLLKLLVPLQCFLRQVHPA